MPKDWIQKIDTEKPCAPAMYDPKRRQWEGL